MSAALHALAHKRASLFLRKVSACLNASRGFSNFEINFPHSVLLIINLILTLALGFAQLDLLR